MINNEFKLYHEYIIRLDDELSTKLIHYTKKYDMKIVGVIRRSLRQFFENELQNDIKKNSMNDDVPNDNIKQLELFVNENCYREKSTVQKTREATIYLEIEQKKAYQRMIHAEEPVEMFPQATEVVNSGKSRDIAADKVGMSGRNLGKALTVIKKMNSTYDEVVNDFFEKSLNINVDATAKLATKSDEVIQEVIEKSNGDPKKVGDILRELAKTEVNFTALPPGQYDVIISDITNRNILELLKTDISSACHDNCHLYIWVTPKQIESGLEVMKKWGFKYFSCFVWNRYLKEVTPFIELALVGYRGNPPDFIKSHAGSPEKPLLFEQILNSYYPNKSKVEILVDEGWKIWPPS